MSRYFLAIGSLAILALACSLGGSDTSEQTSPEDSPSSGGVPISKATPVPAGETDEAPSQEPQPTSPPQPTQSAPTQSAQPPTQPTSDGLPDFGDAPVSIVGLSVAGGEATPWLIGLIQNVGGAPLKSVYVTATFFDANGNEVEEASGSTQASVIPPGGLSPFVMYFPRGVPATVDNVVTTIEWAEAGDDYPWTTEGLEITDLSTGMSFLSFQISGTLRNTTGKMAEFISLLPIAYNADGRFIGYSLKVIENLEAGSSVPFTVGIGENSRSEPTVDNFEILTVVRYAD